MAKFYICVLGLIAVTLGLAFAKTQGEVDEVRAITRPLMDACGEEFGVTREQILAVKASGVVDSLDPCFYACFFKKAGFIDAEGLFDKNVVVEKNKKIFKSPDDVAAIEKVANTCSEVNKATVTDGSKACERAKLLVACLIKEKSTFTPFEV